MEQVNTSKSSACFATGTPPASASGGYSQALHVLAWVTACAVFPLIFMGGLVTSNKAGLAVPDWPNSYGYNMFLFPPSQWVGGIFFEHTHRLLATVVGFCSILLVLQAWAPARSPAKRYWIAAGAVLSGLVAASMAMVLLMLAGTGQNPATGPLSQVVVFFFSLALILGAAFLPRKREERRWVRWLAVAILGAVIFQGILGGLRVVWVDLNLAVVHGCFAQAFFCLTALMTLVTSRWWLNPPQAPRQHTPAGRALVRLAAAAVIVVYLQLMIGATMRHFDAGLAIPDLPLAYGHLIPPASNQADLAQINAYRLSLHDARLHVVTLWQIWIHFAHRVGAVVVTGVLLALILKVLGQFRQDKAIARPTIGLIFLLVAQLTLGVLTVLLRKPAEIATAHVAVGALVLVTTFVVLVRSLRLYGRGRLAIAEPTSLAPVARPVTA